MMVMTVMTFMMMMVMMHHHDGLTYHVSSAGKPQHWGTDPLVQQPAHPAPLSCVAAGCVEHQSDDAGLLDPPVLEGLLDGLQLVLGLPGAHSCN